MPPKVEQKANSAQAAKAEPEEKKMKMTVLSEPEKRLLLSLPRCDTSPPKYPSESDISKGIAMPLEDFAAIQYKCVVQKLSLFLYDDKDVALRQPLYKLPAPKIADEASGSGNTMTSFKEPWNYQNCLTCLEKTGLYESTLPVWKLNPINSSPSKSHSWRQYFACKGHFSELNYINSSEREDQRRFIMPGFIPTSVKQLAEVQAAIDNQAASGADFKDLPVTSGHVMLWGLLGCLLDALVAENIDKVRIMALFEATLTITVRMRLNPSAMQVVLDQISFSEALRVQSLASGANSFFEFVVLLGEIPEISENDTGPKLVETLKTLGVQYNGKGIERTLAYAILAILPYAKNTAASGAIRLVDGYAPKLLQDYSKFMRICQVSKKITAPGNMFEVFTLFMQQLYVDLVSGELQVDDGTLEFFLGTKNTSVGYVHTQQRKAYWIKWFIHEQLSQAASGANSTVLSSVGLAQIRHTFSSPLFFSNSLQTFLSLEFR